MEAVWDVPASMVLDKPPQKRAAHMNSCQALGLSSHLRPTGLSTAEKIAGNDCKVTDNSHLPPCCRLETVLFDCKNCFPTCELLKHLRLIWEPRRKGHGNPFSF